MLIDFEQGYLTATAEGYRIPLLQPESEDDVLAVLCDTDHIIEQIREREEFRNYTPETWIFDSATTLETLLMGYPTRVDDQRRVIRRGAGIMSVDRERDNERPTIQDYGDLSGKMVGFFNAVRQMPYHTVVTAHAHIGEVEEDSKKTLAQRNRNPGRNMGLPALTGKLQYRADNLCDFFIHTYMEKKGQSVVWKASFLPSGLWHAKSRLASIMPATMENPSFDQMIGYYRQAVEKGVS